MKHSRILLTCSTKHDTEAETACTTRRVDTADIIEAGMNMTTVYENDASLGPIRRERQERFGSNIWVS